MSTYWPTPQEYNEAIQTPMVSFSDEELKRGVIGLTPIGLPRAMTGAFASVYKVSTEEGDWAVRCFLSNRPDQKERYEKISQYVLMDNLEYTVSFYYIDEGIRVHGTWYPILKMSWVYGESFDSYLLDNYRDEDKIRQLGSQFEELARGLDEAGMAHGDLQHGNIIVTSEGLRLVDYDALFVPDLAGKVSLEIGHPNYQHPGRNEHHYDTHVDNFSCWLISMSLDMVATDPQLFDSFSGGDECILFRQSDLSSPETSTLFRSLLNHEYEKIREQATLLLRMLWARPERIPELHHEHELELLPMVKPTPEPDIEERSDELYLDEDQGSQLTVNDISSGTRFHKDQRLAWSVEGERQTSSVNFGWSRVSRAISNCSSTVHRYLSPHSWIESRVNYGDKLMGQGDYEAAIQAYLSCYKQADRLVSAPLSSRLYVRVCLKLGNSLMLAGKENLATNYFYLAQSRTKDNRHSNESVLALTTFLLAFNRYVKGDADEAYLLLLEQDNLFETLKLVMDHETCRGLVERPETLVMLLDMDKRLEIDRGSDQFERLVSSCVLLYSRINGRTSIRLDRRMAELSLFLADREFKNEELQKARRHFRIAVDTMCLIIDKQGEEQRPDRGHDYLYELFSDCGMEDSLSRYRALVDFCQRLLNLTLVESDPGFKDAIVQLEDLESIEIYNCLEAYVMDEEARLFDYSTLLSWTLEQGYLKTYEAVSCVLLNFGDTGEIVEHIEFLSRLEQSSELIAFLKLLTSSFPTEDTVKVGRSLSNEAYLAAIDFFEYHIADRGEVEDLLHHISVLEKDGDSEGAIDFLVKLLQERDSVTGLSVVAALSRRGGSSLIKALHRNYPHLVAPLLVKSGSQKDIVQHTELMLHLEGVSAVRDHIAALIRRRPADFIESLCDSAMNRSSAGADYIVFFVYLASSEHERKRQIERLIDLKRFDKLLSILFRLTYLEDSVRISEYLGYVRSITEMTTIKSPETHIYADEYLVTAARVSRALMAEEKEFDYSVWKEALRCELDRKFSHRIRLIEKAG